MDRLLANESKGADTATGSPIAWSSGMSADALGNLAHELRTPIQVILGMLDILQDEYVEQMDDQVRSLIERMNVNALELGQTLDNLMSFAIAQAGNPALVDEDLSIESILADIGPTLDGANRAKGLKLILDFKDAPPLIRGPRRAIVSTVTNLALNAIKFTPAGSVTIGLRQTQLPEGVPAIAIEVSDTGPGMSQADLDEAMRPFVQLSTTSARRYRGIGLGLAIVSQNLAALKGRLDLSATPGGGATFTVRFPERAMATQRRPRRTVGASRVPSLPHQPTPQPTRGAVVR